MKMVTYAKKKMVTPFSSEDIEYVLTKKGEPVAVIVSIDRFRSLAETLGIMSDKEFMASIKRAKEELRKGRKLLSREEVFGGL